MNDNEIERLEATVQYLFDMTDEEFDQFFEEHSEREIDEKIGEELDEVLEEKTMLEFRQEVQEHLNQ